MNLEILIIGTTISCAAFLVAMGRWCYRNPVQAVSAKFSQSQPNLGQSQPKFRQIQANSGNLSQSQALLRFACVSSVKGNSDIPLEVREGSLLQGIGQGQKSANVAGTGKR
jgi:hypothetical protein